MKTLALIIALASTGCTVTVTPDGSRTYSADSEMWLKGIMFAAKAIPIHTEK